MGVLPGHLRERKLVQWCLAYIAGAFAVLQALDFVAEPWNIPALFVRSCQLLAVSGFLGTLVVAWYHGERGRQRAGRTELLLLSLILAASATGLGVLVRRQHMAAEYLAEPVAGTTDRPPLHIAVLPPEVRGTADSGTLGPLLQELLTLELARRRGLAVMDPLSTNTLRAAAVRDLPDRPYERLQRAGLGYAVRVSLTRDASGTAVDYWVADTRTGELSGAGQFMAKDERRLPAQIREAAARLTTALDEATGGVSRALDLQPWLTARAGNVAAVREFMDGTAYTYRGLKGGSAHYLRALTIDPNYIAPRVWLVSALLTKGDTAGARQHVRVLRRLAVGASAFDRAMIDWADARTRGDREGMVRYLQAALIYSPGNNVLLYNLAYTLWELGRSAEAMNVLRPTIEAQWPHSAAYVLWGVLGIETGQLEGLRRTAEEGQTVLPQDAYLSGVLEALAVFDGDTVAAARYGATFAQRTGREGAADVMRLYLSLAEIARERHATRTRVALLRHAASANPRHPLVQLELARALAESGQTREAEQLYLNARAAAPVPGPAEAKFLYRLGEVAATLGRKTEAVDAFTLSLQLAPDAPEAPRARERLRALSRSSADTVLHRSPEPGRS